MISRGFGVSSIIDELKRRDSDLLVMGSITITLIEKTKVPIMAIPE
jgi:hypothetical protein